MPEPEDLRSLAARAPTISQLSSERRLPARQGDPNGRPAGGAEHACAYLQGTTADGAEARPSRADRAAAPRPLQAG